MSVVKEDRLELVEHRGGCHCGGVTWKVLAPPDLTGNNDSHWVKVDYYWAVSLQLFSVTALFVRWNKTITSLFQKTDLFWKLGNPWYQPTPSTHTQLSQNILLTFLSQTWNLDTNFVLCVEFRVSTFQDLTRTGLVWCLTASPLEQLEIQKSSTSRGTSGRNPSSRTISSRKCLKNKSSIIINLLLTICEYLPMSGFEKMSIQTNCNYHIFVGDNWHL